MMLSKIENRQFARVDGGNLDSQGVALPFKCQVTEIVRDEVVYHVSFLCLF